MKGEHALEEKLFRRILLCALYIAIDGTGCLNKSLCLLTKGYWLPIAQKCNQKPLVDSFVGFLSIKCNGQVKKDG
jgi:hypothetical protein